ncbi:MAG: hypothetical protein JST28_03120 [Acidobacteria bacterium]|nr:hypothetical protein [Acidobacteriota bacterium]
MRLRRRALRKSRIDGRFRYMGFGFRGTRRLGLATMVWLGVLIAVPGRAEAPLDAVSAFEAYAARAEARLAEQHRSATGFVASVEAGGKTAERIQQGEVIIEKLTPDKGEVPGGMLHDWRGTAFVKGATASDFERLMKNIGGYTQMYSPEVVQARVVSPQSRPIPDHFSAEMRVKQKHVITVVLDSTYDVTYGRLDPRHGFSTSRSMKVSEIENAGTEKERALPPDKEHGYLWRLNSYWSYEERDGGLYMQIESVSLTRGIPAGLAWAIGPFVESVPRESLEFTLRNTRKALAR